MMTHQEKVTTPLPAELRLPLEVRVHGRGGQGGVTCAKLVAALYAQMGLNVQTFGDYGSERSGAPVRAYVRVDSDPITNRNKVYEPDHLFVLDEGLLGPDVLAGVHAGASILLNSADGLETFAGRFGDYRFGVVPATEIAREHGIGTSSVVIINTTMMGAYARLLGIPFEVLEQSYPQLGLADDLGAAREAYDQVAIQPGPPPSAVRRTGSGVETDLPGVTPYTEHTRDVRPTLKTGTWSNLAPAYRRTEAPCNRACPAGNDVVGFVQALKSAGIDSAAEILLRTQPLPSVCGRVCPAPCMGECNRGVYDGAVNVRSLERWIGDHTTLLPSQGATDKPRRIAVVGGGPAGLSAAYQLAARGHGVTLFEAAPKLGGVLFNGIPAFRLPPEVLERDVERILSLGVKAECNRRLDKADLVRLERDYDAVLVCTGFGEPMALAADGEQLGGVEQGLVFLDRVKQGDVSVAGRVVVVGGGNTAIDCARSALRCGAESVTMVYRRSREEMPAIVEEIEEALREGVRLLPHRQPVAFGGEHQVSDVVLAEVEPGPPDASGRRRPVVTGRTSRLACDKVLLALGQYTDIAVLPDGWQLRDGRAWIGDLPRPVWFAGDCATGEGTVTHAIGNGRKAALAALAALAREALPAGEAELPVVAPAQVRFSHFDVTPPHRDRHLPVAVGRNSFAESNLGLAGPEEADRCFSCGQCTRCDTCLVYCPEGVIRREVDGYLVNDDYCKGCGMCVAECPRAAMEMIARKEERKVNAR